MIWKRMVKLKKEINFVRDFREKVKIEIIKDRNSEG